jgi:Capsule assembly protein Wzi
MKFRSGVAMIAAALLTQGVAAQGFFLPANDLRLREDLTLLADQGVVKLPVSEWPLPRRDVAEAVAAVKVETLAEPALRAALARVQAATAEPKDADLWNIREVSATAGQPGLLRDFGTLGRENGELTTTGGAGTDRYSITLAATGAVNPSDGQHLRFDGSDISVRWGNWLFSANQMGRWWGPGYDGSLLLSTNARPMPALSLDRLRSLPIDLPVLRWLGPWRFTTFFGVGERHRADVDQPLFMGMRLSFKPSTWFEFAMSRSAQFCGKDRECTIGTFGRMLIGQDNRGLRGLSNNPAKEPGNQMAGFEARITSPFKPIPVALYAQEIGEDNSSSGIPERYLGLFGGEMWFMLDTGSILRAHIEYANTKVKWYNRDAEFNTAYRQYIFFAGYRYRGRNIGHTTDADSETASVGLSLTNPRGNRWSALYRHGALDRDGSVDPYNLVTAGRSTYKSMQLAWDGQFGAGNGLGVQLGYEKQSPSSAGDAKGLFGFIQWRRALQ